MNSKTSLATVLLSSVISLLPAAVPAGDVRSLDGEWRFALDRDNRGVAERWFGRALAQRIRLPGTLSAQGVGDDVTPAIKWVGGIIDRSYFTAPEFEPYRRAGNIKVPFWLQPEKYYAGAAWYQRDLEIPAIWSGRRVELTLERPRWQTRVWLNGHELGTRDSLAAHGMSDQAHAFLLASGKLQALCYKEDIESALRTPGMGGFQLLDLHDFPGQGTALVGVLDPFWEEKGYISPAEYSRFCNATVPLARLDRRVFTVEEKIEAELEVALEKSVTYYVTLPLRIIALWAWNSTE